MGGKDPATRVRGKGFCDNAFSGIEAFIFNDIRLNFNFQNGYRSSITKMDLLKTKGVCIPRGKWMSFYEDIFDLRGRSYNHAMERFPDARHFERALLLELLQPKAGDFIIDAPAGGGYLADGLSQHGASPVCIEPSEVFGIPLSDKFETHISHIYSLPDFSHRIDKVASLAGLHHLDESEIQDFFDQSYMAMCDGGVIAVADVMKGTPVAEFLNGPVDKWTETGHDGRFFEKNDFFGFLEKSGFVKISEEHKEFLWVFDDFDGLVDFCRHLFGLVKAKKDEVASVLEELLGVEEFDGGVGLRWSLLYAKAEKQVAV